MSLIDIGDGILVNDEDGEVIEAPEGTGDMAALMVSRAYHAGQQAKRWAAIEGAAKAVILRLQAEKTARYGNIVAQRRQSNRPVFDSGRFRHWAKRQELFVTDYEALAFAAKGFNTKALAADHSYLVKGIEECTDKVPTREFVVLDVVAEIAPGTQAAGA